MYTQKRVITNPNVDHTHIHIHILTCTHTHYYIYIQLYWLIYSCTPTPTHTHNTYTNTHMHMHVCIHIHVCMHDYVHMTHNVDQVSLYNYDREIKTTHWLRLIKKIVNPRASARGKVISPSVCCCHCRRWYPQKTEIYKSKWVMDREWHKTVKIGEKLT